jgi:uncharacterized protein (TIGR03067 family)
MRCLMAMAVVTALVLAGGSVGSAAGGKKAAIQGNWNLLKIKFSDKEETIPEGEKATVTFAADGKVTMDKGGKLEEGTYKVNDSKKPHQLDLTMKEGDKVRTIPAIYEITGDTLRIAVIRGKDKDVPRPESFNAEGVFLLTFKRASK